MELALDGDVVAGIALLGYEVDASVHLVAAFWPVVPEPDAAKPLGVHGVGSEIVEDEPFELVAFVAVARG